MFDYSKAVKISFILIALELCSSIEHQHKNCNATTKDINNANPAKKVSSTTLYGNSFTLEQFLM